MNQISYFLFFVLLPFTSFSQDGPINVHLKTGEVLSTQYAYLSNDNYFSLPFVRIHDRDGEKIQIHRVSHIEGNDQNGEYKFFKPILLQGSTIWGERTYHSDRIDLYYTRVFSGTWSYSYSSRHFNYSKDGEPLKKLKYSNLKFDLSDNAKSMQHLKKGNTLRITQMLLYGLGATLIGVAISKDFSDDTLPPPGETRFRIQPALVAGAITLYIPWIINGRKQKHFTEALKAYE